MAATDVIEFAADYLFKLWRDIENGPELCDVKCIFGINILFLIPDVLFFSILIKSWFPLVIMTPLVILVYCYKVAARELIVVRIEDEREKYILLLYLSWAVFLILALWFGFQYV